jgi:hypothetical protein
MVPMAAVVFPLPFPVKTMFRPRVDRFGKLGRLVMAKHSFLKVLATEKINLLQGGLK